VLQTTIGIGKGNGKNQRLISPRIYTVFFFPNGMHMGEQAMSGDKFGRSQQARTFVRALHVSTLKLESNAKIPINGVPEKAAHRPYIWCVHTRTI
jgi:hypothetical protein